MRKNAFIGAGVKSFMQGALHAPSSVKTFATGLPNAIKAGVSAPIVQKGSAQKAVKRFDNMGLSLMAHANSSIHPKTQGLFGTIGEVAQAVSS